LTFPGLCLTYFFVHLGELFFFPCFRPLVLAIPIPVAQFLMTLDSSDTEQIPRHQLCVPDFFAQPSTALQATSLP